MEFELSHAQQEIKDQAVEFADREVAPYFSRSSPGRLYGTMRAGGVRRGGTDFLLRAADRRDQPCRRGHWGYARGAYERGHVAHLYLWKRGAEGTLRTGPGAWEKIGCFALTESTTEARSSFFRP